MLLSAQATPDLSRRLDSAVSALEARGFSGVVRVDRAGVTLLRKGYGLSNRAAKTAFTPTSVVQIGSNTKDFTTVAILQLREAGKLALTDSLAAFFPDAPADKRGITIQQLMNHTAGFPIGLGGDFEAVSRPEFIQRAMARPLLFAPGKGEQYSNTGFALLAAIIELRSGMTFDEYVQRNILDRVGLKHTGYLLPHFDPATVAHGYRGAEDTGDFLSRPHAADGVYWNLRGNGGFLSTVDDMHDFYRALFETETVLKAGSRGGRFNPDQPVGLAGSDLVSSFLYERLPRERIEIEIASNSAEFRLPQIRGAVAAVLGLPSPDGGPIRAQTTDRKNVTPPSPAVAAVVRGFIDQVNGGDAAKLAAYMAEHFAIDPGSPTAEQRATRWMGTRDNLGALTVVSVDQLPDEVVEVSVTSVNEGKVTLRFVMGDGKVKGVQVLVGG